MQLRFCFCLIIFCVLQGRLSAQQLPYQNPRLPHAVRVKDLLSRMKPEEKFWQLFMAPGSLADTNQLRKSVFGLQLNASTQTNTTQQVLQYGNGQDALSFTKQVNAVQAFLIRQTRLGIPGIFFEEGLHGLVARGATVFPQSIALAASFDTLLMQSVATAIAQEARLRGIRQILSPVLNIATDPRWGRTEETYGEDPLLSSWMAQAYIRAMEQAGVITTPKHFIANLGDGGRDSYPIHYNERLLRELYYPPFYNAITKAGARSIMTAYNSIDGSPASANQHILQKVLKKDWGFRGFVISDANAVGGANVLHMTAKDYADAGKQSIQNGLDVIFQTDLKHHALFMPPFLNGAITQRSIDEAVSRVLLAKFQLGLFDQPYVAVPEPDSIKALSAKHHALARAAAQQSIVLLKNKQEVLPIQSSVKKIAVIGSDATAARLGGYSGTGNRVVSILDGIQEVFGSKATIVHTTGCARTSSKYQTFPSKLLWVEAKGIWQQGLKANFYASPGSADAAVASRIDPLIDAHWTLYPPVPEVKPDHYAVEWTGYLKPDTTGIFELGLEGNDGYRLYLNDQLLIAEDNKQSFHLRTVTLPLQKDSLYPIKVQFRETQGNGRIRLVTNMHVADQDSRLIQDAVAVAKDADIMLAVVGIEEGEFRDRAQLSLPGKQAMQLQALAATGKPLVVIITGGSAVTMQPWLDVADAVLMAWYPGEAGGMAVADILCGKINPSGKLPINFPLAEGQLPLSYWHKPTGRGDDYADLTGQPLFPFGYGLSYTQFSLSELKLSQQRIRAGESVTLSCVIENKGKYPGTEVVQLYLRDELASVARPLQELKNFQRVQVEPGERKQISFVLKPEDFQMLNTKMESVIEPGMFRIMVGTSSRELALKAQIEILPKK